MALPDPAKDVLFSSPQDTTLVCFTAEDVKLFSAASHDRNPLHISETYARATPYGEPVVFGMLGAMAALGQLQDRDDRILQRISIEFRNPLAMGVPYRLQVTESSIDQALVKLYDAARLMAKVTFTLVPGHAGSTFSTYPQAAPLVESADRKRKDFVLGEGTTGSYSPSNGPFQELVERWGLAGKGATASHLAAMLWASYLVGMELPGKRAIFWRATFDFTPDGGQSKNPFSYEVRIQDFDERVDLLCTEGNFFSDGTLSATAKMWAFLRQDSPMSSLTQITDLLPKSDLLRGKVALIIGGSRGLGAAITQALASQGCSVLVNYHQCRTEAEQLQTSLSERSDLIELVQGNAADVEWCRTLSQRILKRYGGLDMLVCNASPPIRPLPFLPDKLEQFQTFLAQSAALVSVPMASFLEFLSERSGWNIVISSAFVTDLPEEWPHYVTAKCAVEGLAQWAAAHHPNIRNVIVRPPKLLTDQTNTTVGRQGAMRVEPVAVSLVKTLCGPQSALNMQILEGF
jgi:NAD(P)-dependent dehydrogenase (short-subunit alcohol dehydrogenase family)